MMVNVKSSSHSKETRFVCKSCSRTFRRVEHLRRHETSHTGTRPHVCPKCQATFFRGDVLVRHMRNVHKTMISGVKELRSSSQLLLDRDGQPASNAAGTSASVGVHHSNPNPNRHHSTPSIGPSSPSNPYGQRWVQFQYSPVSGQTPYGSPSGYNIPAGISAHPSPQLQNQPRSSYGLYAAQPQHPIAHTVQNGSPIIAPSSSMMGHSNPPIQNLIAYGYGPYAPNVPGWTDTTPMSSTSAAEHSPLNQADVAVESTPDSTSSSHMSSESKSGPRTDSSSGTSYMSTSTAATSNSGSSGEPSGFFNSKQKDLDSGKTHDERTHFPDATSSSFYLPTAASELQPFPDLYNSKPDDVSQRKQSSVNGCYSFDTHLESVLHVSYPPQQHLVENPSSFDTREGNLNKPSGIFNGSGYATRFPPRQRMLSPDVDKKWSTDEENTEPPNHVLDNCPACGEPYKTMNGDTHDFSFLLIGSYTDFSSVIGSLVGPPEIGVPSVVQLDRYLSYYASFCHPVNPMIYQPTFDPKEARPAQLFAICSLGASVLQEYTMARMLHFNADRLLAQDWKAFLLSGSDTMDLDTWLYFMQTSIYVEYQAFAMASTASLLNVSFAMRDLQTKLFSYYPKISFHESDPNLSQDRWILEQKVIRCFAMALIQEHVLVCCYDYEPRGHQILETCKDIPLPCSEILWNTSFKSEASWRVHYKYEVTTSKSSSDPQTFGDLLTELSKFNLNELRTRIPHWTLTPMANILFMTMFSVECENRQARIDRNSDFMSILWRLLCDIQPSIGQCAILCPKDEPTYHAFMPLMGPNAYDKQPISIWNRIWQNQHPLVALANIAVESSQVGQLVGLSAIKQSVRGFEPEKIAEALINALFANQAQDMAPMLPIVGAVLDFIRFSLIVGRKALVRFNMLYSFSFMRTLGVLLSHRTLSLFSCWVFATELKVRSGQKVDENCRIALKYVFKSCLDCDVPGIAPLPPATSADGEAGSKPGVNIPTATSNPVKLSLTVGILRLMGVFSRELSESMPGIPFYKALVNVSVYLENKAISPTIP